MCRFFHRLVARRQTTLVDEHYPALPDYCSGTAVAYCRETNKLFPIYLNFISPVNCTADYYTLVFCQGFCRWPFLHASWLDHSVWPSAWGHLWNMSKKISDLQILPILIDLGRFGLYFGLSKVSQLSMTFFAAACCAFFILVPVPVYFSAQKLAKSDCQAITWSKFQNNGKRFVMRRALFTIEHVFWLEFVELRDFVDLWPIR